MGQKSSKGKGKGDAENPAEAKILGQQRRQEAMTKQVAKLTALPTWNQKTLDELRGIFKEFADEEVVDMETATLAGAQYDYFTRYTDARKKLAETIMTALETHESEEDSAHLALDFIQEHTDRIPNFGGGSPGIMTTHFWRYVNLMRMLTLTLRLQASPNPSLRAHAGAIATVEIDDRINSAQTCLFSDQRTMDAVLRCSVAELQTVHRLPVGKDGAMKEVGGSDFARVAQTLDYWLRHEHAPCTKAPCKNRRPLILWLIRALNDLCDGNHAPNKMGLVIRVLMDCTFPTGIQQTRGGPTQSSIRIEEADWFFFQNGGVEAVFRAFTLMAASGDEIPFSTLYFLSSLCDARRAPDMRKYAAIGNRFVELGILDALRIRDRGDVVHVLNALMHTSADHVGKRNTETGYRWPYDYLASEDQCSFLPVARKSRVATQLVERCISVHEAEWRQRGERLFSWDALHFLADMAALGHYGVQQVVETDLFDSLIPQMCECVNLWTLESPRVLLSALFDDTPRRGTKYDD